MKKKLLIVFSIFLTAFSSARAGDLLDGANYDFTNYAETGGCKFRMWVPPTCQYVRGVLVALTQMQETVSLDPEIRKACMLEDLAIVWADNLTDSNGFTTLNAGLSALATASGMQEVATAPFATIGHSMSGIYCRTIAAEKPDRCFGIIQLNAVEYSNNEALVDIPWITIKNGAEETGDTWLQARDLLVNGETSPRANGCRISLISLINGGHFGWPPFEAKLVSAFIQKAAHYQIAENGQAITRIPEEDGWLTDIETVDVPQYAAAAYEDYEGDKEKAFWHMDEEYANMWVEMHQAEAAKQVQQISLSTFDAGGESVVWQSSSKKFNLNNGGLVAPYPHDAASSIASNPVKVKTYRGFFKVENGTDLYFSPARHNYLGTKDWITFYQEGTETERYAEITTGQVEVQNMPDGKTLTITQILDQDIATEAVPYNVSGSDNIDDWVVSGPVSKDGANWKINNYTSVPKMQVYIRHAAGNSSTLKETKFEITNNRTAQTIIFDENLPSEISIEDLSPVTLSATSTGADATISYSLLSGPAALEGDVLTPSGELGTITILAIARNDANNPAKAVLTIPVKDIVSGLIVSGANKVSVYPNPVEDMLNMNASAGSEFQLKDIAGRLILSGVASEGTTSVSVAGLPAGIYLLSLNNGNTVKIIKK